jgi:hypothetical protein
MEKLVKEYHLNQKAIDYAHSCLYAVKTTQVYGKPVIPQLVNHTKVFTLLKTCRKEDKNETI